MRVSVLFGSASLAALVLSHPGAAFAQEDDAGAVDEIIVTAQKREQSLQDVPIVVTAVSGRLMRDAGVHDIKDLQLLTPGLLVTSTTGENVTTARIRGVGTVGDNPGLESSVGVVIDGVYRPRNGVSFGDLGPLDRIEVLKGPQGTLFGKNTSAGVINVISARPGAKLAARSEASFGNYGAVAASQSVSGPLVADRLGAGVYFAVGKRDGFYDVDTGNLRANRRGDSQNQNFWTARAQVLYTPTSEVDLRLIADYTRRDEDCCVSVGVNPNATQAIITALAGARAADSRPFERVAYSDRGTPQDVEDRGISAQLDWDTGWADAKLTAITALRKWTSRNGIDGDFSLADLIYRDTDGSFFTGFRQFSQELRLAGSAGNLTWLVGGFFANEKLDYRASFLYGRDLEPYFGLAFSGGRNPTLVSQLAGVAPGLIVPGTGQVDAFAQDSKSYALFTNNSYAVGKLELTLGLRYTIENKEMDARYDNRGDGAACAATLARAAQVQAALGAAATQYLGAICAPFSDPGFNALDTHQERDEKEWSGTLKAAYRFNPQLLTYVSYARGYKAGGFNLDRARIGIGVPDPDTSFPGEFVDSYEAGIKSTLFGRTLLANASAFYQKFKDFQLNTFTGVSFVVTPIPKVVSRGIDADFVWFTPLRGLSFQGGVTYAETEYGDFTPGPGISFRLPGARMSFAPLWSGALSGTYEQPVAEDLMMRTNLSAKYTSSYNTGSDLAPGKRQKALTLINARIGFGPRNEAWTVEAWAQNLTDEHYYQVVFDATLQTGQLNAFLGAPRTYGMTLRMKY